MYGLLTQPLLLSAAWPSADSATARLPRIGDGLDHLGVTSTDADGLVAVVAPVLRTARAAGHAVTAIAGRRTVGLLREALGTDADALASLSPAEILRPGPERLIATLCTEVRLAPRRAFVLVEYPAAADPADVAEWEAACALVLGDRALTLVCACARGAHAETAGAVRVRHPALLTPTGRRPSPEHRRPPDSSPTPAGLWGRRVLRFSVGQEDGDDDDRLRVRVSRTASGVGLTGDAIEEAVRAAEEAVRLAGEPGHDRVVELRVHDAHLLVDVVGTRPGNLREPTPTDLEPPLVPTGGAAAVHDEGTTRRVRVLCPAPGRS